MPADVIDLPPPLAALLQRHRRVLLAGAPGSGKSTLARALAAHLVERGRDCRCLSADPGLPGVGPPGAICLGRWAATADAAGDWRLEALAALASLNAARFRLPLVEAARRLARQAGEGPLLIDAPGVIRGVAGAELLPALAEATGATALVMLTPDGAPAPLAAECRALSLETLCLPPAGAARHPGRQARTQRRTAAWDAYLADAGERCLELAALAVTGTPPPRAAPEAWRGRQVGLLDARGDTLALGEILALAQERLQLRTPAFSGTPATLLVRDALRRRDGQLGTARAQRPPPSSMPTTPRLAARDGPPPSVPLGTATATLINGVLGDPLLQLRLHQQKRSLLFDLGDAGRLPARLAHRISDVFISHAHFDHIGGFLWLLRSRIGDYPPCRFYGPPGLAAHLAGLVRGILWDRVEAKAPRFEIHELHGATLQRYRLVAGAGDPHPQPSRAAPEGRLLEEPGFRVRATTLDHGTPVLAFAFEPNTRVRVRKEQLAARGWPPGPWLGELKYRALAGESAAEILLPDGSRRATGQLAQALLESEPGQRLVYATDLADTAENRRRLIALARGARVLFCEAPFLSGEAAQARSTGHLTARACGEIAAAAGVERLVPFHFSRRHAGNARALLAEIRTAFGGPLGGVQA